MKVLYFVSCTVLLVAFHSHIHCTQIAVIKRHDDQAEGLTRAEIIDVVRAASGWTLTKTQATNTWDDTIHQFGKDAGLLTGYVKPQQGTSKRTAAGSIKLQKRWHMTIDALYKQLLDHNTKLVGIDKAQKLMAHCCFNLDEECVMATGKNIKIVGSQDKKKHDNEKGSSRDSVTNLRYTTYTYTHTHIHIHAYSHTCIHTYAYTHTHIHTYTYMHTHIHTYTYMHTHIHAYIHTYT